MIYVEHRLSPWEWRGGEITLPKNVIEKLLDKRYNTYIGTQLYPDRKITKKGRIYLGSHALQVFQVGDNLSIEIEENEIKVWKKS